MNFIQNNHKRRQPLVPFDYQKYQNSSEFIPQLVLSFQEVCRLNNIINLNISSNHTLIQGLLLQLGFIIKEHLLKELLLYSSFHFTFDHALHKVVQKVKTLQPAAQTKYNIDQQIDPILLAEWIYHNQKKIEFDITKAERNLYEQNQIALKLKQLEEETIIEQFPKQNKPLNSFERFRSLTSGLELKAKKKFQDLVTPISQTLDQIKFIQRQYCQEQGINLKSLPSDFRFPKDVESKTKRLKSDVESILNEMMMEGEKDIRFKKKVQEAFKEFQVSRVSKSEIRKKRENKTESTQRLQQLKKSKDKFSSDIIHSFEKSIIMAGNSHHIFNRPISIHSAIKLKTNQ